MNKFFEILKNVPKYIKSYNRISMHISAIIDDSLKEKGWSQKVLAEKLDKNESEISKFLSGKHNFTIKTISKLEEAFDKQILFTSYDLKSRLTSYKAYSNIHSGSSCIFYVRASGQSRISTKNYVTGVWAVNPHSLSKLQKTSWFLPHATNFIIPGSVEEKGNLSINPSGTLIEQQNLY